MVNAARYMWIWMQRGIKLTNIGYIIRLLSKYKYCRHGFYGVFTERRKTTTKAAKRAVLHITDMIPDIKYNATGDCNGYCGWHPIPPNTVNHHINSPIIQGTLIQLGQLRLNPPDLAQSEVSGERGLVILENIKEVLEITQPLYPLTTLWASGVSG